MDYLDGNNWGVILNKLKKLDYSDNKPYFTEDEYKLLDEIPEPSEGSVPATASVINAINDIASNALIDGHRVCILTTEENADCFEAGHVITVGSAADGGTVAARLYAALRECDAYGADIILSETFAGTDLSSAIMNRLIKAAGHRVIKV